MFNHHSPAELLAEGLYRLQAALAQLLPGQHCRSVVRLQLTSPLASARLGMAEAWLTYTDAALAHALPNDVWLLGHSTEVLQAWHAVLNDMEDEKQAQWLVELVLPRAVFALNLPYAIRNRIEFLCYALTL